MAIPYTTELFIFDTLTQFVIVIATIIMYVKTRELWQLSLQKGIKYLNNAMLYYIISFGIRYTMSVLDFAADQTYGTFQSSTWGLILSVFNIYGAFMGGLYLAYSLVWRKFEKDRIKRFHPLRLTIINIIVILLIAVDMYLIVANKQNIPFIFFGVVIGGLIYAITANCIRCSKRDIKITNINPFLSLVGLGLGVYIVIFFENLFVRQFFPIHYYASGLGVVFSIAFLYNILKIAK